MCHASCPRNFFRLCTMYGDGGRKGVVNLGKKTRWRRGQRNSQLITIKNGLKFLLLFYTAMYTFNSCTYIHIYMAILYIYIVYIITLFCTLCPRHPHLIMEMLICLALQSSDPQLPIISRRFFTVFQTHFPRAPPLNWLHLAVASQRKCSCLVFFFFCHHAINFQLTLCQKQTTRTTTMIMANGWRIMGGASGQVVLLWKWSRHRLGHR